MITCAGSSLSIRTVAPREPGNARVPVSVAWITVCAVSSESALSYRSRIAIVATTAPMDTVINRLNCAAARLRCRVFPSDSGESAEAEPSARATSVSYQGGNCGHEQSLKGAPNRL